VLAMSFSNLDRVSIYWLLVMMSHALNIHSFRQGSCNQTAQNQLVQSQLEALK